MRPDDHQGITQSDEDPFSDANLTDPYPLFGRLRASGPAVWLNGYDVLAFTRFSAVREILVDHVSFISGAGVGPRNHHHDKPWRKPGILETDPPDHTRLRAVMTDVLSPRNVRTLRAQFEQFAALLVGQLLERGEFDGVRDCAQEFPLKVFGDAVGIATEGRRENLLAHGAMNFSSFGPEDDRQAQFMRDGAHTTDWVMSNCARENLSEDGLGAQIWAHADAGDIDADDAAILVRALLSAGLDTTVLSLGNTLACLAAHPDQWSKLRDNPRLTRFAIDEALRYDSPFQAFYRTAGADVSLDGVDVAADQKVLLFPGAANRDDTRWGPGADRYDIDRNAGGHLTFGMGIHQCVGQALSRLEMDVFVTELAKRASTIEIVGEPEPFLHNTLRGWSRLPLRVRPA